MIEIDVCVVQHGGSLWVFAVPAQPFGVWRVIARTLQAVGARMGREQECLALARCELVQIVIVPGGSSEEGQ